MEKIRQTLTAELGVYESNAEEFLSVLTRIALITEKAILSDIYEWRDISRKEEFETQPKDNYAIQ